MDILTYRYEAARALLAIALFFGIAPSCGSAPARSLSPAARWRLGYTSRDPQMYHGLSFTDATNGWMVGDAGRILHSRDGGYTWQPQTNSSKVRLTRVQFVNPLAGWAVGASNSVLRTSDGGRSWVLDHPPGGPARRTFLALHFIDERDGWVAHNFGGLLRTLDGGRSWTAQENLAPDALLSIAFPDATNGWVLGVSGTLLQTTDGGESWSSRRLSTLPQAVASFSALFLLDRTHGWIGTDTSISSRLEDVPPLFRTSDGGQTWAVHGNWPGSSIRAVQFQEAQSGWCASMGAIYSTNDGGSTWRKELESDGDPFVQVMFAGPGRGWALTLTGNVYHYSQQTR